MELKNGQVYWADLCALRVSKSETHDLYYGPSNYYRCAFHRLDVNW